MSGWFFPSSTTRSSQSSSPSPSPSPSPVASSSVPDSGADAEDSRLGFDHEALEQAAKKIKQINSNRYSGEVRVFWYFGGFFKILLLDLFVLFDFVMKLFKVMRKQEDTRQAELDAEKAHYACILARADIVSTGFLHLS